MIVKHYPLKFRNLSIREFTDLIVIHHTGNPADDDLSAEDIHKSHLRRGWSGIGYHFIIRKDGTIEAGRPFRTIGAHAYGFNSHSIGIMLSGNFEISTPTSEQLHSLQLLIKHLQMIYGNADFTKLYINGGSIAMHRDLMPTLCPGTRFTLKMLEDVIHDKIE